MKQPEVIVRRATADDAPALVRIYSGQRALRGTLQIPFTSEEASRKRLAEAPEGTYPLVAEVDGEVVGQLTLRTNPNSPRRRHAGSVGMAVRDDWQSRGVGTALLAACVGMAVRDDWQSRGVGTALLAACVDLADNWLNLRRLELDVFVDNEAAIRLYTKFGFEIEGTLRRFAFRDGHYIDTYTMARLRGEQVA